MVKERLFLFHGRSLFGSPVLYLFHSHSLFFPSLSLRLYVGYIQVRKFLKVDRAFDLKIRFWKVYNNNKRKENSKTKMTPD